MPFCDQCGAENPDMARFCDQCGNPLAPIVASAGAGAPPARGTPEAPAATPAVGPASCPQCGTSVIPGEAFCDNCGAPLMASLAGGGAGNQAGGIPPQQHYPAPQPWETPATPPTPAMSMPPTTSAAQGTIRTTFEATHLLLPASNVTLPLPPVAQILLGRADAVSGFYPDVDLTQYEGLENGVGRRHARLTIQQGQVFVEDLDSTNGTFLNGQRMQPHAPQPLNAGDDLRLGTLALRLQL